MLKKNTRNFIALTFLLAGLAMLVWSAQSFVLTHYPHWVGRSVDRSSITASQSQVPARAQYKLKEITSAQLFGATKKVAPKVEKAPETKLKLKLFGVLASDQDEFARAMIQVASKQMKVYAIGESIEGTDAALHKVESRRVIIDRKGSLESLVMSRQKAPIKMSPALQQQLLQEGRSSRKVLSNTS